MEELVRMSIMKSGGPYACLISKVPCCDRSWLHHHHTILCLRQAFAQR